jgi:hypothetical protein
MGFIKRMKTLSGAAWGVVHVPGLAQEAMTVGEQHQEPGTVRKPLAKMQACSL